MQFFAGLALFVFIFAAVLLILLVLIQNDQGEGLGGLFSGSSSSPFGGQGANALQRITSMLALLFFVSAVGYGLTTRARYSIGLDVNSSFQGENQNSAPWWSDQAVIPDSELTDQTGEVEPTAVEK